MLQFRGLRLARDGELSRRVTVFALPRQSSRVHHEVEKFGVVDVVSEEE